MTSTSPIEQWLDRLSVAQTAADATNQFAYGNPYNDVRRANLRRYLEQMAALKPTVMLVGEAPGYRGSRLTGIPFGSRRVVLQGVPELGLFGVQNGYQDAPEPGFERIQGEQSATAVWGTLASLRQAPLIWAAFPYHPHLLGEPLTNRKLRDGPGDDVLAVGNVGEEALKRLGITAVKISACHCCAYLIALYPNISPLNAPARSNTTSSTAKSTT